MLFVWLRKAPLLRLVNDSDKTALRPKGFKPDAARNAQERRIFWFNLWVVVRTVGWSMGFALGIVAIVLMGILYAVALTPVTVVDLAPVLDVLLRVTFFLFMPGWFLLNVIVGWAVPATRLARRVRVLEFASRSSASGLSRASAVSTLQASGAVARTFFRLLTQHVINAGVRPDIARDVAEMSRSIMLRKPDGSLDGFRTRGADLDAYVLFLRDVVGLVVMERLDVLPALMTPEMSKILVVPESSDVDDIEAYLRPLLGRSPIAVFTEIVLPIGATVISLCALAVSIWLS